MLHKVMVWLCVMLLLAAPLTALGEEEKTVLVDAISKPSLLEEFAFPEGAELLEIFFPQVRDCDAALVRCGGKTMLIDCASASQGTRVTALLEQLGVERIDYLVNTHPHNDHIEGLPYVADKAEIGALYICFPEDITERMKKAVAVAEERNIPVVQFGDGSSFDMGGTAVDVWMKYPEEGDLNQRSAVLRLQLGERTALFTADITKETQELLAGQIDPALLDIDLLKYPHHGKETLQADFLAATSPVFAVITNNGGMTSSASRKCLGNAHIAYSTTVPGFVYCVTDGETWLVQRLAMDKPATTVTSRPWITN
ncbi:MAG: ComEC/Rec2 family competence protein [Aristaeellaceae bacterium]